MDIAVLGLDIRSTSAAKAANDLDKLTGAAGKAEAAVRRQGDASRKASDAVERAGDATKRAGGAAGLASHDMRMLSFQLNQVAQQGAVTGNYMQALSVQMADILTVFGMWGVLAGGAIAVAGPLVTSFFDASAGAKSLDDAIVGLTEAVDSYRTASEIASGSAKDLWEQFGSASPVMRQVLADMAAVEKIKAYESLDALAGSLRGVVLEATIFSDASANTLAQAFLGFTRNSEVARAEAEQFLGMLDRLGSADPQVRLDAAIMLRAQLDDLTGGFENMDESQRQVYDGLTRTIVNMEALGVRASDAAIEFAGIGDAADGVGISIDDLVAKTSSLAGVALQAAQNIWDAARASAEMHAANQRLAEMQIEFSPGGQAMLRYGGRGVTSNAPVTDGNGNVLRDGVFVDPNAPRGRARRGGGGGTSPEQERQNDLMREAQRIFEDTRTGAERYAAELADLSELQSLGYIDAETYSRAVASIGEQYLDAGAAAQFWKDQAADLKNGFLDAIVAGGDLSDVFGNLAKSIARAALEAALFGSGPLAGGGGSGGILSALFDGFRANGGPVSSGKAYVVGERGPELFVPKSAGGIVSNEAIRGQGGMSGQLSISLGAGLEAEWQGRAAQNAVRVSQAAAQRSARDLPRQIDAYNARGTAR